MEEEKSKDNKDKEQIQKFDFNFRIKESFYYQFGSKHQVKMDYLNFNSDLELYLSGSDEVGSFEITGEISEGLIQFRKRYIGQHSVYYVGWFNGKRILLNYGFEDDYGPIKKDLLKGIVQGEIIFKCIDFKLIFTKGGKEGILQLTQDHKDEHKWRGLANFQKNVSIVNAYFSQGVCQLTMVYSKDKIMKYTGEYDSDKLSCTIPEE